MEQLAFSVEEVCAAIGIGRTKLYEELGKGNLPAKKWGKKTVILKADLEMFLSKLSNYPARKEKEND
jgi:excisionase family DNA binding protein